MTKGKFSRLCFLCAFALSSIRLSAETLTIATYNLENYGPADRVTEMGYRQDYPKPESEKSALRSVILALNADVLVVQEMGPRPFLEELQRDLKVAGLDYPHVALLDGPDADRHVALFSKRAPKAVVPHADLEFTYFGAKEKVKRGLLEATFATAAGDVTIFALHLKSRFTDRADDPLSAIRRAGEATAVRDCVLKHFPDPVSARFLIAGDCNDGKTSKTLQHLEQRGKTVVSELLPAIDSRGEVWTHNYRKEETYSHVDSVLISPGLRGAARSVVAKIYDGPGVSEASDHRPVITVFELR